jgi:hypothetical protein
MTDMKYRYSVQYVNKEGNYQEDEVFSTEVEAEQHRDKVIARENKEVKIVDLQKNEDNPY